MLSRLEAEVARLRLENEIRGDGVLREGCAVKYAWIHAQRTAFPLPAMGDALQVSVSGCRVWRPGGTPQKSA
jgi:putative transposase